MGGKGGATNPEQLFAAGYAACFETAVIHVTRNKTTRVTDADVVVVVDVGLQPNGSDGFVRSVALEVTIAGLDHTTAEEIVQAAHATCPYSNAVRGNMDVAITVKTN